MATTTQLVVINDNVPRNTRIYPAACGPVDWVDDVVYHPIRKTSSVRYVRESRTKPKVLIDNMTPREFVYHYDDQTGISYKETQIPCPHNGIHGMVIVRSYKTDVSNLNAGFLYPDYDDFMSRNIWATKFREKLGNQQVNLGSSLAEYRESCKMFASFGRSLWNGYKVLRGRAKRKKITMRDIPASILAYNFGIAPLANDLYSSVEMLRYRMEKPVRTKVSAVYTQPRGFSGELSGYHIEAEGRIRQRAVFYITRSNFAGLNGDFDFGNPIEWAWELIPFSFVVDWAIPIGEWLGSLDAMVGVDTSGGTVVTKSTIRATYRKADATHILSEGHFTSDTYQRQVFDTVPISTFPKWNPSMSWRRVMNATSLLWLLSGRLKRKH